jgi:hypothetical protein
MQILTFWRTNNRKTGDVPTVAVHPDDLPGSCTGCAWRPRTEGGNGGCYARIGRVALGLKRSVTAKTPSFLAGVEKVGVALQLRSAAARMLRVTSVGDVGRCPELMPPLVAAARDAGLQLVGYTHHWREPIAAPWRGVLMASCDGTGPEAAAPALGAGWRAAVAITNADKDTFIEAHGRAGRLPSGHAWLVCPAVVAEGVTCNTCRLCDASRPGPVVVFPRHGSAVAMASLGK